MPAVCMNLFPRKRLSRCGRERLEMAPTPRAPAAGRKKEAERPNTTQRQAMSLLTAAVDPDVEETEILSLCPMKCFPEIFGPFIVPIRH